MHFVFNLLCINRLPYYHTIIDVRAIVTNGKCMVINKFTLLLYYQQWLSFVCCSWKLAYIHILTHKHYFSTTGERLLREIWFM